MLASIWGGIGRLIVSECTLYLSYKINAAKYIYYSQATIAFVYMIIVIIGMKDVMRDKSLDSRRSKSNSIPKKISLK